MGGGQPQTDPMAIASIAVSLVSFVVCFVCGCMIPLLGPAGGGVFALAGVVLGGISLSRQSKEPEKYGGKPLAIAGIVVGVLSLLLVILTIILAVLGLATMPSAPR